MDLAADTPLGCTVWYGVGAFRVVAFARPGIVRRRATELAVLGFLGFLLALGLTLGSAGAVAEGGPIGGMPGGRTGKLGGVIRAGVLDASSGCAGTNTTLGAGGGRNGVVGGYDFLRAGWGGVSLTWYTRSCPGLSWRRCQCRPSESGGL